MHNSNDLFSLPVGPDELCFDKNEFIKKTFSVDEFLHDYRNAAGLEAMRDDLGIYLKVLRSAMIELINVDYADFVNLSSNLIGLDKSINGIQIPLTQLKEDIITVKITLTDTMTDLLNCLEEKKSLRTNLKSIQSVAKVRFSIKKLDDLLNNLLNADECDPVVLERAALVIIQLQFDMQFCAKLINNNNGQTKHSELNQVLMAQIEKYYLLTLNNKNTENLERCLRIYCTLDECKAAEDIFRKNIVAPHMHSIISESSLQNCPQGLFGIYSQIIEFIDRDMTNLLVLTKRNGKIKGFDFILNSFWTEVETRLETHMSSIFAPGNPDLFYQKYKNTMEFLNRLESIIGMEEDISLFRNHPQYKSFQTRWNLPVYFQIRFQELGAGLETICSKPINELNISSSDSLKLAPFSTAIICISKCWSDGIYLPQIFVRFWTLTLQMIARITLWVDECLILKTWPNDYNDGMKKIDFFVAIYMDMMTLIENIPQILENIKTKTPLQIKLHLTLLDKCMSESSDQLKAKIAIIQQRIVKEILDKSVGSITQTNDIPRLFRKTNRDIPSKPCSYVDQILEPSKSFYEKYSKDINRNTMLMLMCDVFSSLNIQYYSAIDDVLTSVQKTEESLRRLKNLREKSVGNPSTSDRMGMSDDDKIRLQLQVDVIYWTTEIKKLGIDKEEIKKLDELNILVAETTKIKFQTDK